MNRPTTVFVEIALVVSASLGVVVRAHTLDVNLFLRGGYCHVLNQVSHCLASRTRSNRDMVLVPYWLRV